MTEKELLACVRELARLAGWLCYHTHDSRRSEPGFPDVVLVRGGRVLFRELKVGRNHVTPTQARWLDRLREAGADAAVWRDTDWLDGTIERGLTSA